MIWLMSCHPSQGLRKILRNWSLNYIDMYASARACGLRKNQMQEKYSTFFARCAMLSSSLNILYINSRCWRVHFSHLRRRRQQRARWPGWRCRQGSNGVANSYAPPPLLITHRTIAAQLNTESKEHSYPTHNTLLPANFDFNGCKNVEVEYDEWEMRMNMGCKKNGSYLHASEELEIGMSTEIG